MLIGIKQRVYGPGGLSRGGLECWAYIHLLKGYFVWTSVLSIFLKGTWQVIKINMKHI